MTLVQDIMINVSLAQILSVGYVIALLLFIVILWRISTDKNHKYHWIGIISNPDGSASLTRILQLVAGVTATWAVVKYTIALKLSVEMFATYLAAMGISEAFTKWVQSKGTKE